MEYDYDKNKCECIGWARDCHTPEEFMEYHHKWCPNKPKKFAKITLHSGGSYIQALDELHQALDVEMDGAEVGAKWTIELVEMSQAEYESLPEFAGH